MDELVRQAMAKWPNVPDCVGWLGLDQRGQWWMRDAASQACGGFASGQAGSKGSLLRHDKLIDFIGRNYASDALGRWFFQNGPQRVFVELEVTPWVWRIDSAGRVQSHTGRDAEVESAWVDEHGRLFLSCDLGLGLVHTLDMLQAAERLEQGLWTFEEVLAAQLPQRFGFVPSPEQARKSRHEAG